MRNWSVDEKKLKKSPQKYRLWKLEQQLSYGLDKDEKISRKELVKNWTTIKARLDPDRQKFLSFLLWQ